MTKAEGAALAELLSVAEDILEECLKDPSVETVKIDKYKKQRLMDGYTGVMAIITGHRQSAQEKLATNKTWMAVIRNRNHQLKLTDDKGEALEEPKTREVMEAVRQQTIMEQIDSGKWADPGASKLAEEIGKPQGVHPDDGEEVDLFGDDDQADQAEDEGDQAEPEPQTITETFENGVTATWPTIPGVPEHVQAGLIQAIRDGNSKAKACELVAKEVGLDKFTCNGFFEDLLRAGIFEKRGKDWIAHLPTERPPAEASIG